MIKILRKSWQQVVSVMLAIVMLAIPAIAGVAAAKVSGLSSGNGAVNYNVLTGAELDQLIQQALNDKDVETLRNELSFNNEKIAESIGAEWNYNNKKGKVLLLSFKDSDKEIQLFYGESQGKTKAGAGVIQTVNGNKKIEAFDVGNGKIYHSATIDVINGKVQTTWHESPFVPSGKIGTEGIVTPNTLGNCNSCKYWCNIIDGAINCSIGGLLACAAICGPGIGVCAAICAVLYGIICTVGTTVNCDCFCRGTGYCPGGPC